MLRGFCVRGKESFEGRMRVGSRRELWMSVTSGCHHIGIAPIFAPGGIIRNAHASKQVGRVLWAWRLG